MDDNDVAEQPTLHTIRTGLEDYVREPVEPLDVIVFYGTVHGRACSIAHIIEEKCKALGHNARVVDLATFEGVRCYLVDRGMDQWGLCNDCIHAVGPFSLPVIDES